MTNTTHHSLLVRLADVDDQRAWEEFFSIYQPLIHRLALGRGFQDADASEIAQEVMLSVSRSIGNYVPGKHPGSFRAWLAKITRNQALNRLRRRAVPVVGGSTFMKKLIEASDESTASDDEHRAFDQEARRQIFRYAAERIRHRFSEQNWQAFWLTCVEGATATDVASRLGIPVGQVYVARCRVIARLRETVEQITEQP
jgi:RNA polymerase sigma-70 factor (ECF subfamily)